MGCWIKETSNYYWWSFNVQRMSWCVNLKGLHPPVPSESITHHKRDITKAPYSIFILFSANRGGIYSKVWWVCWWMSCNKGSTKNWSTPMVQRSPEIHLDEVICSLTLIHSCWKWGCLKLFFSGRKHQYKQGEKRNEWKTLPPNLSITGWSSGKIWELLLQNHGCWGGRGEIVSHSLRINCNNIRYHHDIHIDG